jgi:hypothetical protein
MNDSHPLVDQFSGSGHQKLGPIHDPNAAIAGATFVLAARGQGVLDDQIQALRNSGAAAVHTTTFDADDLTSHAGLLDQMHRTPSLRVV